MFEGEMHKGFFSVCIVLYPGVNSHNTKLHSISCDRSRATQNISKTKREWNIVAYNAQQNSHGDQFWHQNRGATVMRCGVK